MSKSYLAQLDRFGYVLTAVGRTKKEAADAVLKSYTNTFKSENGIDPRNDYIPNTEPKQTYFSLAETELYVTPICSGECLWL